MTTEHDDIERVANAQRARLARTLGALDEKRHGLERSLRRATSPLVAGLAIVVGVGATALLAMLATRRERRLRRPNGFFGLRARWLPPPPPEKRSLFAKLAERALLALLDVAIRSLATRAGAVGGALSEKNA